MKQLLLTRDIKNYPDLGQCYPPQPLADNIDLGLDNSGYAQPHPIIVYYYMADRSICKNGEY